MPLVPFSIGITGGIGSGKSTIADMFADLGIAIIDTDVIAHALTAPSGRAIEHIRQQFGDAYIDKSGAMDRAKMRAQVFQNPTAKKELEQILHPMIKEECELQATNAQSAYLLFVVPLLVESGTWKDRLDRVLVVDCAEETQIRRVMMRNGYSRDQVNAIMQTQAQRDVRRSFADDCIDSDQDLSQVRIEVSKLHQKYQNMALSH